MIQIGNYSVEEIPIGSGGMGQVLKGFAPNGTPVAIKKILPQFVADIEFRSRILSEIEFLKKLDHGSVVKVYDYFEMDGNLFIVMELVEGLNIEQYVEANGAIPYEKAMEYMIKILDAMQYVHEKNIVHRDIKPGNIMLRKDGSICLLDFGVAKDLSKQNSGGTVFGTVIGTDGYMSPEQADGMSIDHRSDVYALGCVFYYMLTGRHAYTKMASDLETQLNIINKPFPRISDIIKGVPSAVQTVLDGAVDKNMMKRYQSCREFKENIIRIMPGGTHLSSGTVNRDISVSVGRENCDICVGTNNFKVSRHHADIKLKQFTGGVFFVYTDCSSNGTIIDGQRYGKGMSYNIPLGANPEILLAGDPSCRLDLQEVAKKLKALETEREKSFFEELPGKNGQTNSGVINSQKTNLSHSKSTSFFGAVKTCFCKYADFKGRASSSEFWYFWLFNFIINNIFNMLYTSYEIMFLVSLLYFFATLLPYLAVAIRRFHDIGKNWATILWMLLPIFGWIYILILLCRKSEPTTNKYGPCPS